MRGKLDTFIRVCSKNIVAAQEGWQLVRVAVYNMPYEGPNSANQINRKLGVFGRKLEGSHSQYYHYFDKY